MNKPLPRFFAATLGLLALFFAGCVVSPKSKAAPPPLVLISMDGFRWDYCALHPAETPHLRALIRDGVTARGLIPMFPSQTFANHYSIATGLYPAHHGIISNVFFDPQFGEYFRYKLPAANRDSRWWGGEPIWITAVKQGRTAACYFWPGSEVNFGPLRATISKPYDYSVPFAQRIDELFGWLHLPAGQRPSITTFYFEETNFAGHRFGPDSPEVLAAIKLLDNQIGQIVERAKAENLPLNLVIVSDHGFIATQGQLKTAMLDDSIDFDAVQVDFDGAVAGLRPNNGQVDALVQSLRARLPAAHYQVYRAEDLPARWHLRDNPRIPPVWIVPEASWRIQRRSTFLAGKDDELKGDHGYDPAMPEMHGIFIANGPSFKTGGVVLDEFENIHIYNLLCAALQLRPAPSDGDDRLVRTALR